MRSYLFLPAAALIASPALADHAGPSGVGGGSLNVLSPDTLDEGALAAGLRLSGVRPAQRSSETLAALARQDINAHNTDYNLNVSAGLAYGITHDLTVSLELPYVRRDSLREGTANAIPGQGGVSPLGTVAGVGDASVLAKYRISKSPGRMVSLIGGIKLPTGSTGERTATGERLETEHQPGTGSLDPVVGAAFGTGSRTIRLSASGLYQFSGKGAQNTRLGDRAQAGIALSHHFGPPPHHHDDAEAEETGRDHAGHAGHRGHPSWDAFVELTGEWEGRQRVDGTIEPESGGSALWLSPGGRFTSVGGFSVGAAIGVPVAQHIRASHPETRARLIVSLGRTF